METQLERNTKNPDIRCPVCGLGMDVYTESNEDKEYKIDCLECKSTFIIKQLMFKKIEVK